MLNVLKVNPAKRRYERLGFRVVREGGGSYEMRFDPRGVMHDPATDP